MTITTKNKIFVFYKIIFYFVLGFGFIIKNEATYAQVNDFKVIEKNSFEIKFVINNDSSNCRCLIVLRKFVESKMLPDINKNYEIDERKLDFGKLTPIRDSATSFVIFDKKGKAQFLPFSISNLDPGTKYSVEFFKIYENKTYKSLDELSETYSFTTLSLKPTVQASQIGFRDEDSNKIFVRWTDGNGTGRLVLVRKDSIPELPNDGFVYKSSPIFGTDSCKIGKNTYVIYNSFSKKQNNVTVTNLPFGIYYFHVIEYNGTGESINYLSKEGKLNPRKNYTKLNPPIALKATEIFETGFTANWTKIEGCHNYEVDLAYDNDFNQILDGYQAADVGELTYFEITGLEKNKKYYYRVRAINMQNRSENSNVIMVDLRQKK